MTWQQLCGLKNPRDTVLLAKFQKVPTASKQSFVPFLPENASIFDEEEKRMEIKKDRLCICLPHNCFRFFAKPNGSGNGKENGIKNSIKSEKLLDYSKLVQVTVKDFYGQVFQGNFRNQNILKSTLFYGILKLKSIITSLAYNFSYCHKDFLIVESTKSVPEFRI